MLTLVAFLVAACGDEGGVYCCTYGERSTGCGGIGWSGWETEYYQFNIDDYLDGWSPERVCNKFRGDDTACSASCCIEIQKRDNVVSSGECAGPSI